MKVEYKKLDECENFTDSIYDKANLMKLIDINININFLRNKFDMLTNWIHRDCNDF